jgi:molybdate transport system substrate-binding protein
MPNRAGILMRCLALLAALVATPARAQPADLVVFAAASLKNALDATAAAWQRETGVAVRISYAASSALARQIEQGAPADLFVSADLDWMDYVAERNLVKAGSRTNLLRNRLVMVAPRTNAAPIDLATAGSLLARLDGGRLAMANVDSVPAGKYGRAALTTLGHWKAVESRVAQAENVRAALLLVSRGEANLGIVYQTDAASDPGVAVVATFPETTHPPIVYPAALTAAARHARAQEFLTYLRSSAAAQIFEAHGFTAISRGQS